jgi:hypothetical protein
MARGRASGGGIVRCLLPASVFQTSPPAAAMRPVRDGAGL